jgi:hypothetical protein
MSDGEGKGAAIRRRGAATVVRSARSDFGLGLGWDGRNDLRAPPRRALDLEGEDRSSSPGRHAAARRGQRQLLGVSAAVAVWRAQR